MLKIWSNSRVLQPKPFVSNLSYELWLPILSVLFSFRTISYSLLLSVATEIYILILQSFLCEVEKTLLAYLNL